MVFSMSIWSTKGFNQTRYVTVDIKGLYSLDLPDYLEKTSELSVTASLQFRNLNKKLLVIAIDEEKSKINALQEGFTISDYYDYVAKQVTQKLEDAVIEKPSAKALGALSVLQGGINGKFLGTSLRYIVEVVESEIRYYLVICWTEERALNDVADDIHLIINSFKEVKSP